MQAGANPVAVARQCVLEPVQGLHDPHGGPTGPVEAAGRGLFELDEQLVQLDRAAARIGMDRDPCGDGVGQAKVVGGGHAVHEQAQLVAPGNGIDNGAVVRRGRLLSEQVDCGQVI